LLAITTISGTFNFFQILHYQTNVLLIFPLFPLFLVFLVCIFAETNRVPFDLPEAEAELVAGYNLEYSSISFAMFFLAEYSTMIIMSFLLLFFFFFCLFFFFFFFFLFFFFFCGLLISFSFFYLFLLPLILILFIWVRATLPRYRYDQLMDIGWRVLIPFSLCFLYFVFIILFIFDGFHHVVIDPFFFLILH